MHEVSGRPALEARNINHSYPGRQAFKALNDISISLGEGETLAIVGESGSGKSTLSRILLGLSAPSSGQVLCFGKDIGRLSRRDRAAYMQPVFQDPYSSLNPRHTLAEIVAAPLLARGELRSASLRRAIGLLEEVGLSSTHAQRRPSSLSGGQRQRAAIARAVIANPEILVCDEPTSALDVSVQAQILNLLQEQRRQRKLSMLLITHNIGVVAHMADRVAVMRHGAVVETGGVHDVLLEPREDYTRLLISSVADLRGGLMTPAATEH